MQRSNSIISILIRFGISLVITVCVAIVLLLAAALILYNIDDATPKIQAASMIVLALTALIGGTIAARFTDGEIIHPVVFSAILGTLFVIITLLVSLIPFNSASEEGKIPEIIFYIITVGLFTLGGVAGRRRERKRLPYKNKYRH